MDKKQSYNATLQKSFCRLLASESNRIARFVNFSKSDGNCFELPNTVSAANLLRLKRVMAQTAIVVKTVV